MVDATDTSEVVEVVNSNAVVEVVAASVDVELVDTRLVVAVVVGTWLVSTTLLEVLGKNENFEKVSLEVSADVL